MILGQVQENYMMRNWNILWFKKVGNDFKRMETCGKDVGIKLNWLTMATSGIFEQGNMIIMDCTQYSP